MTVLQRTNLTTSQKIQCAAAAVAGQHAHGSKTALSERYEISRPTVYAVGAAAQSGTYHAIRPKYAQRYLAEFEYRFNRRFDLPDIIPRLVYVALRTPPMPERLLKLRLA